MSRRMAPQRLNALLLWTACVYFLAPIYWLFVASTKSQSELNVNPGFWFSDLELVGNLETLFTRSDGIFARWMINSVFYAVVGAAGATILAVAAGYAMSKFRFRGKEAAFSLALTGVMVPPAALALPLFLMFSEIGLTDTYAAVLLPSLVSPLGVYLARVSADAGIPDALMEAARVDGAGPIRTFFSVGLPMLRPVSVTIFLFQLVAIWNNFLLPLVMLNSNDKYPVTLGLFTWMGQFIQDSTLITSVIVGSFVSIIPLILGFVILQRYWTAGLTAGAVK